MGIVKNIAIILMNEEFVNRYLIFLTLAVAVALAMPFLIDLYKKHKNDIWNDWDSNKKKPDCAGLIISQLNKDGSIMKRKKNSKKVEQSPPRVTSTKFATLDRDPVPKVENAFTKTFTEFLQIFHMR